MSQISNLIEIGPAGVGLCHADEQTDRQDEANSRFSQFCEKRPRKIMFNKIYEIIYLGLKGKRRDAANASKISKIK
jgi:hypothetical protein